MTRLIDADALRVAIAAYYGRGQGMAYLDVCRVIAAVPTMNCAECEYGPPPADAVGARTACLHCYCGDNWERRQP